MKKRNILLVAFIFALLLIVVGCGDNSKEDNKTTNVISTQVNKQNETSIEYTLYYSDDNGEYLIPSKHKFTGNKEQQYLEIAQALINGPKDPKEGISVFPEGTKILNVSVKDKVAYIDFNRDFEKHFPGGITSELMIVGSIVDTFTSIDGIDAVQILVEGKKIDSLSGHLDLSVPQKKMENLIKK